MQHGNKLNLGPLLNAFNGLFVDSNWRRMNLPKFKKLETFIQKMSVCAEFELLYGFMNTHIGKNK